jgi:hypothetical protein
LPAERSLRLDWEPTAPKRPSLDGAVGGRTSADKAGVVCHVKYPDHPTEKYQDIWDFVVQELKAAPK